MQTQIHDELRSLASVQEADDILRKCVHCGFCNATCPTYQLLGDELDGPRGRIYLMKGLLEQNTIDRRSLTHLDRCLTCRACETTCPSGVQYGRLLDITRQLIVDKHQLPFLQRWRNRLLCMIFADHKLFGKLLRLGQVLKPVLPHSLSTKIPARKVRQHKAEPKQQYERQVLLLDGCVQSQATPQVNHAITELLAGQGIGVLSQSGCCGSLDWHLSGPATARHRMRRLITAMYAQLPQVEAIVSSASGCGVTIKDYADILAGDPLEDQARAIAAKTVDISELFSNFTFTCKPLTVSVHTPCTLQHGQGLNGGIEKILNNAGLNTITAAESHLCCGSAGTYSISHPKLANTLRDRKLKHLTAQQADAIVTANVGCQLHLQSGTTVPVMHWAELLLKQLATK